MKIAREIKKAEAIQRMKELGLFEPCIKNFEKYDEVQMSEVTGGLYEFSGNAELTAKVKEFEEENNALVYHVIHTYTDFGEMYNFLCVTDYEEDWYWDNLSIKDGIVFCWVWNKDVEYFSEFGSIGVQNRFGGLVRTA